MLTTRPRLRIAGQGAGLRVRQRGDWAADKSASLRESCRASIAIEKTIAEAIGGRARAACPGQKSDACSARQIRPTRSKPSSTRSLTTDEQSSSICSERRPNRISLNARPNSDETGQPN